LIEVGLMTVSAAYIGLFIGEGESGGKCPETQKNTVTNHS